MVFLQMHGNGPNNQRPGNNRNSVEHNQSLIRPGRRLMSLLTKCELNPISGLSENARKQLNQSEGSKRCEFSEAWQTLISYQARKGPLWVCFQILSSIWLAACLQMCTNCSINHRPGNSMNSMGDNQKLIRSEENHNECIHQVWDQIPGRSVR